MDLVSTPYHSDLHEMADVIAIDIIAGKLSKQQLEKQLDNAVKAGDLKQEDRDVLSGYISASVRMSKFDRPLLVSKEGLEEFAENDYDEEYELLEENTQITNEDQNNLYEQDEEEEYEEDTIVSSQPNEKRWDIETEDDEEATNELFDSVKDFKEENTSYVRDLDPEDEEDREYFRKKQTK